MANTALIQVYEIDGNPGSTQYGVGLVFPTTGTFAMPYRGDQYTKLYSLLTTSAYPGHTFGVVQTPTQVQALLG